MERKAIRRRGTTTRRKVADLDPEGRQRIAEMARRCVYLGSPLHKLRRGDYGFHPPVAPRPRKSPCERHRQILKAEAQALLEDGFRKGLVSDSTDGEAWPRYVWSVDDNEQVYEAVVNSGGGGRYHGYPIEDETKFCRDVIRLWRQREENV